MSNQTFWVYNKDIFDKVGITDVPEQPTWDQMVDWCEKIKAAGYTCIAQEGTVDRIWGGGKLPWVMRSAMDQYRRVRYPAGAVPARRLVLSRGDRQQVEVRPDRSAQR